MAESFRDEMERRFGSDEALGVWFLTDDGQEITLAEFEKTIKGNPELGAQSMFPDGSSACCCTDFAVQIFRGLPGRVQIFGFANEDNPECRIAKEEWHPGGHDFAVVDGRFIVDPWPRLVPGTMQQMVFDMQDSQEAASVVECYGAQSNWRRMDVAEKLASVPFIPQGPAAATV